MGTEPAATAATVAGRDPSAWQAGHGGGMRGGGGGALYRDGMPYAVQTSVFEGPFDLLLHLILRQQVDLYEISLSAIVDAYLAELAQLEQLDLEIATEFLLIAATLVELKARRLLPDESDLDLDDELAMWEERDLLIARLLECKTFKDASIVLQRLSAEAARSYPRTAGLEDRFLSLTPDLLEGVTADDLGRAVPAIARPQARPDGRDRPHPRGAGQRHRGGRGAARRAAPRSGRVSFRTLTEQLVERLEVVVRFLAVLELFKQGLVDLDQAAAFGDIQILWLGAEGMDDDHRADLAAIDVYEG